MKAIYRRVRISPKKANLVATMVRSSKATQALNTLKFMPKKGARILYHVLKSAIANAEQNFNQDQDKLVIKEIIINKGPVQKRYIPISRGRTHPLLKKTSHITIEVGIPEERTTKDKSEIKRKVEDKKKTKAKSETKTKV